MGISTQSIPFFSDEIIIVPHTASLAKHIGVPVSIRGFSKGRPCSLEQVQETGEYIVRLQNGDFMHGPEHEATKFCREHFVFSRVSA